MAELRNVTVEFDKYKKRGKVYVEFSTKLSEPQDRMVIVEKVKKGVETALTKDDFIWSNLFKVTDLFKVTEVPLHYNKPGWIELRLNLLRVNKPPEWSEEYYEAQITLHVRHLCRVVKYQIDSLEEDILQSRLPEVRWSISQF